MSELPMNINKSVEPEAGTSKNSCSLDDSCGRNTRPIPNKKFTRTKVAKKPQKLKTKFNCKLCKKRCKTDEDLESHLKLHGSFKCKFCQVVKNYAPDLGFHESEHHAVRDEETKRKEKKGLKLIPCSRCPYNCFLRNSFLRHFLNVHLNVDFTGKHLYCSICQAGFMKRHGLNEHFQIFHKIEGLEESAIYRCDLCPAYFLQRKQLLQHKSRIHFKDKKCPECGKILHSYQELRHHLERKHPEFRLFSEESTFICDIGRCRKQFPSQADLDLHKTITSQDHDGDQIFKCDICGKGFRGRKYLHVHKIKVHSEASVICPECGKTFNQKEKLDQHMKYHQAPETWKFQCSTCGRKFAAKQKLDQHQRTHTKEKPFICQYCGGKYAHRHKWRNHVKTKHPEEFEKGGGS